MIVFCNSPFHGRTSVYEEYTECVLALVIRVLEFQKTNSGKNWHATIVAIFWDNFSKILRPNLNGEHFEKINIKTATHITKYSYAKLQSMQIFRLSKQISPKERMIKILRNWHYINTILICGIIISNSIDKFHVIWRQSIFGLNLPQNYFNIEHYGNTTKE